MKDLLNKSLFVEVVKIRAIGQPNYEWFIMKFNVVLLLKLYITF